MTWHQAANVHQQTLRQFLDQADLARGRTDSLVQLLRAAHTENGKLPKLSKLPLQWPGEGQQLHLFRGE